MSLVEGGIGALQVRPERILRLQQRLQVRRVINGVRPGVAREELKVVAEAFGKVDRQAVVHRVAGRLLLVHARPGHLHPRKASRKPC